MCGSSLPRYDADRSGSIELGELVKAVRTWLATDRPDTADARPRSRGSWLTGESPSTRDRREARERSAAARGRRRRRRRAVLARRGAAPARLDKWPYVKDIHRTPPPLA